MIYTFNKELDGDWYISLPDYPGDKADLQMVCGADTMLDIMSEGSDKVMLDISTDVPSENYISFKREEYIISGAFYIMKKYNGIEFNLEMWLCDVTKFIFGCFPEIIYLEKVN